MLKPCQNKMGVYICNQYETVYICNCNHSHKKWYGLEIWSIKLQFLLIYKNMLESIATAIVSAQQNTKTRKATTQTALFLIWLTFLAMIEEIRTQTEKEKFILLKNITLTENCFVANIFHEFPELIFHELMFWPYVFPTKN